MWKKKKKNGILFQISRECAARHSCNSQLICLYQTVHSGTVGRGRRSHRSWVDSTISCIWSWWIVGSTASVTGARRFRETLVLTRVGGFRLDLSPMFSLCHDKPFMCLCVFVQMCVCVYVLSVYVSASVLMVCCGTWYAVRGVGLAVWRCVECTCRR